MPPAELLSAPEGAARLSSDARAPCPLSLEPSSASSDALHLPNSTCRPKAGSSKRSRQSPRAGHMRGSRARAVSPLRVECVSHCHCLCPTRLQTPRRSLSFTTAPSIPATRDANLQSEQKHEWIRDKRRISGRKPLRPVSGHFLHSNTCFIV